MLSCRQITELVSDYIEGNLPASQRARFLLHIGLCRNCRRYLRQLKASVELLGRLPEEPVPAPMMDELKKRLQGWK
jgi:anti-sigma factor RsiW